MADYLDGMLAKILSAINNNDRHTWQLKMAKGFSNYYLRYTL